MKYIIIIIALLSLPILSRGQNVSDSASNYYLNAAGQELTKSATMRNTSMVVALAGGGLMAAGASNTSTNMKPALVVGGLLVAVALVMNIAANGRQAKAGRYLQYATGHIPIPSVKRKAHSKD